jgi:hypothetical protein
VIFGELREKQEATMVLQKKRGKKEEKEKREKEKRK